MLYLLIGFGHESEDVAIKLDPPDDFFRVRLVSAAEWRPPEMRSIAVFDTVQWPCFHPKAGVSKCLVGNSSPEGYRHDNQTSAMW